MPQTTLTPKFVNGPKQPGGKYGSINCDGTYYSFEMSKMSFEKGRTYTVDYVTKNVNGKDFHNITAIVGQAGGQAPQQGQADSGQQPRREEIITRLALAKSCIEANVGLDVADMWLQWVMHTPGELEDYVPF